MSPMELWCNESQERYVLLDRCRAKLDDFTAIARRERCPFAVIGEIDDTGVLVLEDRQHGTRPVDLPLEVLLGKAPKMLRDVRRVTPPQALLPLDELDLRDAAYRLLRFPAVADKTFLISIGDRTVGGMISRDQMVGPWQVPVADVAVTIADYFGHAGEAMAMGERTPVAVLDAPASGRLAVGEALTNILAADIGSLSNVRLSANWMAACGEPGEDAALYATVHAVGEELCPALGIAIPVGKDSLSMKTVWSDGAARKSVVAPVSLIISAFAPVGDVRKTWTPQLRTDLGATTLLLVDLGGGANRLGGSSLAQVYGELGATPPDLDDPAAARRARGCAARSCARRTWCWPITTAPTAACSPRSWKWPSPAIAGSMSNYRPAPTAPPARLFTEELGVVLQVKAGHAATRAGGARRGTAWPNCTHAWVRRRARCACASRRPRAASTRAGRTCAAPGRRPRSACANGAMSPAVRAKNSPRPATAARRASMSR